MNERQQHVSFYKIKLLKQTFTSLLGSRVCVVSRWRICQLIYYPLIVQKLFIWLNICFMSQLAYLMVMFSLLFIFGPNMNNVNTYIPHTISP